MNTACGQPEPEAESEYQPEFKCKPGFGCDSESVPKIEHGTRSGPLTCWGEHRNSCCYSKTLFVTITTVLFLSNTNCGVSSISCCDIGQNDTVGRSRIKPSFCLVFKRS